MKRTRAATAGRGGRGAVESGLDYQLPPMAAREAGPGWEVPIGSGPFDFRAITVPR
jgi:hypothetical protein